MKMNHERRNAKPIDGQAQLGRPKIMLFCPVRLSADQIPDMIRTHRELVGNVTIYYMDDCGPDASALLRELVWKLETDGAPIHVLSMAKSGDSTYADHNWTGDALSRIAKIRREAIQMFVETVDYTHLFMVDADLLLHPMTAAQLAHVGKPIVSGIFWTKWPADQSRYMPNCWDVQPYGFQDSKSIIKLAYPGTYLTGGLGACTLFERDVLTDNLSLDYVPIPGWEQWGEDRWLSMRANVLGIPLYVDTHYPAFHVYTADQLTEAQAWRDHFGSSPNYFRDVWLTPEWEMSVRQLDAGPAGTQNPAPTQPATRQPIVAVCLPGQTFHSLWVSSWSTLLAGLTRMGVLVLPFFGYSSNVYATRSELWHSVRGAKITAPDGTNYTPDYVLWLDDDNTLDPGQFQSMVATLESRREFDMVAGWCWVAPDGYSIAKPIVSAGSFDQSGRCVPLDHKNMANGSEDIIEIGYTGFPAVLMRGSLLGWVHDNVGRLPFKALVSDDYSWGMSGEDVAFCYRLKQAGGRIALDRRIKVPHYKVRPAEPSDDGVALLRADNSDSSGSNESNEPSGSNGNVGTPGDQSALVNPPSVPEPARDAVLSVVH